VDDSEARQILRAHGEDPPKRGKLTANWHSIADHYADADADPGADPGGPVADDYAEGTSPEDFGEPDELEELEAAPPPVRAPVVTAVPSLPAERRPTRPRRPGPAERFAARAKARERKKPRPHKRVPVDGLISSAWAAMGGLAGQMDPPLGRVLVMQAPVSGLILEDIVRGTAVDRVLQPIARAGEKAEMVLALAGPPVIVAALEASATLPEQQMATRQAILLPLLERSLMLWARIAGDKIDTQIKRAAEEGPARERARELMAMIWPDQTPEQDAEQDAERETVNA
jgi:hypothetical protein